MLIDQRKRRDIDSGCISGGSAHNSCSTRKSDHWFYCHWQSVIRRRWCYQREHRVVSFSVCWCSSSIKHGRVSVVLQRSTPLVKVSLSRHLSCSICAAMCCGVTRRQRWSEQGISEQSISLIRKMDFSVTVCSAALSEIGGLRQSKDASCCVLIFYCS